LQFFNLCHDDKFPLARWADNANKMDTVICPVNAGHQRGTERLNDLTITLPSSRIGDFIWTWYSECLITEKVKHLFEEAGLTGYETRPVTVSKVYKYYKEKDIVKINGKAWGVTNVIRDRKPKKIPPLLEVIVKGFAGNAHLDSKIELTYKCEACGLLEFTRKSGQVLVDETQWDGSDFFTVWPLPLYILVSERVKDLIERHELTNCELIPIERMMSNRFTGLGVDMRCLENIKRLTEWKGKLLGE